MSDTQTDAPSTPRPLSLLLEDQRRRWRLGQRALVESYVERQPALRDDAERLLDLIYQEVLLREQAGEAPRLDEYLGRFPQLASQLRVQFEIEPVFHAGSGAAPPPTGDEPTVPQDGRSPTAGPLPQVPGYEVLGVLGRGGMGVVYRARHRALKRLVALKMVRAGDAADPEQCARFKAEAEAAARLQHPNIVQVYEVGEHEGRPLLALEYVDGGSLAQRLDGTPLPARPAAALVEVLARAIHHAHQHGVIHRDLKPGNVLLLSSGDPGASTPGSPLHGVVPKITDFGLAKQLGDESGHTRTGAILGTPSYMAPEQAEGRPGAAGPAADVYALGAVLYELLSGRPPFKAATVLETLDQVRTAEPVPPRRLQPNLPRDLETICLKCLHKEPEKRYAGADLLAEDLRRFGAGEPVLARPTPAWERLLKWVRRRPAVAALVATAGLALLGLLGGGAWYNARLDDALRDAQVKEEDARTKGEAADRAYRRADANFRRVQQAVDEMLTQLSEDKLAQVPQVIPVRRALLRRALALYQELLQESNDDPGVLDRTADVRFRTGNLHGQLGEFDAAVTAYQEAAAAYTRLIHDFPAEPAYRDRLAHVHSRRGDALDRKGDVARAEQAYAAVREVSEGLVAEFPAHPGYRWRLAGALSSLGRVFRHTSRFEDAEATQRRAYDLLQALVQEAPGEFSFRQDLGLACNNLGVLWADKKEFGKAERYYEEAIRHQEKLVADRPQAKEYRTNLAASSHNLAIVLEHSGRSPQAEERYRRAAAVWEKLIQDFPEVAKFRFDLGTVRHNLGMLLARTERREEALAAYGQALSLQDALVREFPDVPSYRSDAASTRGEMAVVLLGQKKLAEARALVEKAVEGQLLAYGSNPRGPSYREQLRTHYRQLAEILLLVGDHAGAARLTAKFPEIIPDTYVEEIRAACVLVRCVPLAEGDATLPEPQRAAAAESYAAQAVERLRRAAQKGFRNAEDLRTTPVLAPLRSRSDFRQLLQELGKAGRHGS
jgi:eukaryotic-like serine/threonine-protein kinase